MLTSTTKPANSAFIVLLSGGLDSVINLHEAALAGNILRALTFDYGQRAAKKEIEAAQYFCEKLKVEHVVMSLPWLKSLTKTALVVTSQDLPHLKDLDDSAEGSASAKAVWVPNRNGVFLNIAASFAESLKADYVVPGFNKEEASTFPDNSQEFIAATNAAFKLSTMSHVEVKCFTTEMDKSDLVRRARELHIDFTHIWSCYQDGNEPCGQCESCQRTKRALEIIGI